MAVRCNMCGTLRQPHQLNPLGVCMTVECGKTILCLNAYCPKCGEKMEQLMGITNAVFCLKCHWNAVAHFEKSKQVKAI